MQPAADAVDRRDVAARTERDAIFDLALRSALRRIADDERLQLRVRGRHYGSELPLERCERQA
jgi:hypothetical protein